MYEARAVELIARCGSAVVRRPPMTHVETLSTMDATQRSTIDIDEWLSEESYFNLVQ